MQLRLRPGDDGTTTWLSVSGPLSELSGAARDTMLRRLVGLLARWHGGPLFAVSSVDVADAWSTRWNESLATLPRDLVRLRVRRPRAKASTERQLEMFGESS